METARAITADIQPPTGCQMCMNGRKAQLHLTLECNIHCYFCPIKESEFGTDVMEVRGRKYDASTPMAVMLDDIVNDPSVDGAAISGGEPLMHPERTYQAIEYLRLRRGPQFHIHLYSNGIAIDAAVLRRLNALKINELRVNSLKPRIFSQLAGAQFQVVCEIPCIPDPRYLERLCELLPELPRYGVHALNLNELEATEETRQIYLRKGFAIEGNRAVESAAYARQIRQFIAERDLDISVFFCNFEIAEKIRISRNRLENGTLS